MIAELDASRRAYLLERLDGATQTLVTTTDTIAVGDVVVAKGTVRTDVTIGAGYAYEVLVEGAKLSKS